MEKKILIIEDEPDISDILRYALAKENFKVRCAYRGSEVITIMEEFNADLVILDVMLPDISGFELCKALVNSIKYSIPNSEIKICTTNSLYEFQFYIENISEEILKEKFDSIFEPFFKANINKSKELGSNGLGLYICKQIVANYKGSIDIDYFENKFIAKVTFPNII